MTSFSSAAVLLSLSATAFSTLAATPNASILPGPAFPVFATPMALKGACDSGLTAAQAKLKQLERRRVDKAWLAAFDAFNGQVEDLSGPATFLSAVHPDKALRDASEACELRWNDFFSSLGQNERLFQAAKRIQPADTIDGELRRTLLEGFEDAGVGLPKAERARAKQLLDKINELGQVFERNIRDAKVRVTFTEAELRGVPEAFLKNAKRDANGRVELGVDYPSYDPVMHAAEDGAARERMMRAKNNEGGEANLKLLAEIAQLRKEYAALFGVNSYAEFVVRRRMAKSPAQVQRFLGEVKAAVQTREVRELEELRAAKATHLKLPLADVKLERWDASFYTERVRRERYSVDQETFRPYFPPEQSLQFAMRLVEKLMGVKYERVQGVTTWHPEVQAYAVRDASSGIASGKPIAALYVDLYPRDGKYNHAAVWSFRNGSVAAQRVPQAALVVNFDRKGLTLNELETLLHELGHAVHNNLSATRYSQQAGTQVLRDFVEAPSQMLEEWAYDKNVLKLFAEVCPDCKPVPDALLAQANTARRFGQGIREARQHLYASYDLALYSEGSNDDKTREPMALWANMEGATPLGHVKGTMFPAGFSHIASGYAAGYYGYLWSLVLATDMRTAFAADKLDAKVGQRYRQAVLGQGSQKLPSQLVKDFLGREFSSKAFFEELSK
jgi:thimet oligopeptidase